VLSFHGVPPKLISATNEFGGRLCKHSPAGSGILTSFRNQTLSSMGSILVYRFRVHIFSPAVLLIQLKRPPFFERALRDGQIRIGKTPCLFGQNHPLRLCITPCGDCVHVHAARYGRCIEDRAMRAFRIPFICKRRNNFAE
jgi:hypothetical protein